MADKSLTNTLIKKWTKSSEDRNDWKINWTRRRHLNPKIVTFENDRIVIKKFDKLYQDDYVRLQQITAAYRCTFNYWIPVKVCRQLHYRYYRDGMTMLYCRVDRSYQQYNVEDDDMYVNVDFVPRLVRNIRQPNVHDESIQLKSKLIDKVNTLDLPIFDRCNQPMYDRNDEIVYMPSITQFSSISNYYSCLMHEIGHWIRYKYVLNYPDCNESMHQLGSTDDVFEEAIVEMFSYLITNKYKVSDIDSRTQSIDYIIDWLSDKRIRVLLDNSDISMNEIIDEVKTSAQNCVKIFEAL